MAVRLLLILFCSVLLSQATVVRGPVVDLGYELHEATVNETGSYYNFSNVRYAAAPTGNLRFAAPEPPATTDEPVINDGKTAFICPQGSPQWVGITFAYLAGQNVSVGNESVYTIGNIPPVDPRTNEDCLFLDVTVPKKVFDTPGRNGKGAPVLLWFHGGGFGLGAKDLWGNGAGLVARSLENDQSGIIYVAANYRLGLFGWLSGDDSITSNAGFLDQKLAIEWVKKYIRLFGGDPDNITLIGESAGGSSIMAHIATNDGNDDKKALFSRAILQSPWLLPYHEKPQAKALYDQVLQAANVSNFEQLRDLPSATLQTVNSLLIGRAPWGTFGFGPSIDSKTTPDEPVTLLKKGLFDPNIDLMIGRTSKEGAFFTPPFMTASCSFQCFFSHVLPQMSRKTLSYISGSLYNFEQSNGLYPNSAANISYGDDLNSIQGQHLDLVANTTSPRDQYGQAYADATINCNVEHFKSAYPESPYAYIFSYPPGIHAADLSFTFSNAIAPEEGVMDDAWLAVTMQRYFVNFAISGSPNTPLPVPFWPRTSNNKTALKFDNVGFGVQQDDVNIRKCDVWERLLGY